MGLFSNNKISRDDLKPGDHIYAWRNAYIYSHHGDGKVIHFTRGDGPSIREGSVLDKIIVSSVTNHGGYNPCPNCGKRSNTRGVISSCLDCFLARGDLHLFKYSVSLATFMTKLRGGTCTTAPSDPSDEVISRAKFLLMINGFGDYHLFKNNCEDFAMYCKTSLVVGQSYVLGRNGQANTVGLAACVARMLTPLVRNVIRLFSDVGIYVGDGKVIHFTRGGGLEIGTGTILDKIIVSSVPNHGGDNPCPDCGDQTNLNGVITSCLDCFLSGGNLYLFEYNVSKAIFLAKQRGGTCTIAASDPPEDVVARAKFLLLRNGFGEYHLLDNNCEDFAIYCKTGLLVLSVTKSGSSSQVNSVCAAGGVVTLTLRALGVGTSGSLATASSPALTVSASTSALSTTLGAVATGVGAVALTGYGNYCISRLAYDIGVRKDVRKVPVEELVTLMAVIQGKSDNNNNKECKLS
ncbi:hypothetical protein Bca101_047258 [Brassica carinata]